MSLTQNSRGLKDRVSLPASGTESRKFKWEILEERGPQKAQDTKSSYEPHLHPCAAEHRLPAKHRGEGERSPSVRARVRPLSGFWEEAVLWMDLVHFPARVQLGPEEAEALLAGGVRCYRPMGREAGKGEEKLGSKGTEK